LSSLDPGGPHSQPIKTMAVDAIRQPHDVVIRSDVIV
jgi:hypothetical protein